MTLKDDGIGWSVRNGVGVLSKVHIEGNEGNGVLVPDAILVKCGVSSCLVYNENCESNCSTFYYGDVTKCDRFTQVRLVEKKENVEEVSKIRKIYF